MRLASLFFAVLCAFAAAAQELLSVPGPEMGINVIPAARNRWTLQRIQPADESRLATPVVRTDLDLFSLEYGASLKPWSFAVPDGVYEVRVLYADCWNKEPGVWQTLKVGTDVRRYDTVRDVGRCAAGVHVFRDVRPENGRITVTLEFGIINGIEIFKRSKGGK